MQHQEASYGELAYALRAHRAVLSYALTNKLHRGTYSFAFAVQALAAL